jgi:hypothetical protein
MREPHVSPHAAALVGTGPALLYAGGLGAGAGAGAGLFVPLFSSFSPPHCGLASSGAANAGATAARATEASKLATIVLLERRFMSASLRPPVRSVKLRAPTSWHELRTASL